ncbi:hypothetical protein Xgly_08000 [Xanthomonas citri pv. glycines]|uniref:Uncharacterized protein n=1 Tax=Xanthomonas campestris pv. glycines TaxID=473421 RepID=A0AAX0I250_XANCG|nr:hypothetical protein BHE84_11745 [Xanthomonas citri pv. glycines str. 8ra]ARV23507.1 hypothetical protein A9D66_13070 [Xanthomonas citri pv. glycines str. 12-2]OEY90819.1 hypothetical protein BIY41_13090 [Xanthomonas citri pv. glycines]OOX05007.1 hypothetical protein Xgly_08000 [Xanthomonas citri pv. glycines]QDR45609.1 hypothetical protein FPK90_13735 [Xanthomonas citri pv. glycines]
MVPAERLTEFVLAGTSVITRKARAAQEARRNVILGIYVIIILTCMFFLELGDLSGLIKII